MKFKLVIFDVDGTLTRGDNSWKLIHSSLNVYEQAKKHRELFFNHEISYQEWANLDVGLWKNTPVKKIAEILDKIELNDGIAETVAFLKRKKYKLALLSSGITLLTDKLKEKFGFHYSIANHVCTSLFQKVGLSIAFNPINSRVASVADVTIRGSDLRKILKYIP
ncbi:MAG: HAD-IB family phosphatase [Candidatus Helarchaeota archaeon]